MHLKSYSKIYLKIKTISTIATIMYSVIKKLSLCFSSKYFLFYLFFQKTWCLNLPNTIFAKAKYHILYISQMLQTIFLPKETHFLLALIFAVGAVFVSIDVWQNAMLKPAYKHTAYLPYPRQSFQHTNHADLYHMVAYISCYYGNSSFHIKQSSPYNHCWLLLTLHHVYIDYINNIVYVYI